MTNRALTTQRPYRQSNRHLVCDRTYVDKADGRSGGVGTEAQIISAEIYSKQAQDIVLAQHCPGRAEQLIRRRDSACGQGIRACQKSPLFNVFCLKGCGQRGEIFELRWRISADLGHPRPNERRANQRWYNLRRGVFKSLRCEQ